MRGKLLAIAVAVPGVSDAGEAASLLARSLRAADRSLDSGNLVPFPWLDGSRGTLDFLVTHTLGSFLEVEATGASGDEIVAPLGFAGEDGKLAVIEMARVAQVPTAGESGTTAGIGELIQDALNEGAFSILLCHEEPLAFDAGFGAAAAMGVRFFNTEDKLLNFSKPGSQLSEVQRIDTSGRSFALLSSRLFLTRSTRTGTVTPMPEQRKELKRLAKIVQRDTGIPVAAGKLHDRSSSASAVEFGICALLGAEIRDGATLILEATRIEEQISRGEFSSAILLAPSLAVLEEEPLDRFIELLRARIERRAVILHAPLVERDGTLDDRSSSLREAVYSLAQVPIFQQPLRANATAEELRRDFTMRLEKLLPDVLIALHQEPAVDDRSSLDERSPKPNRTRRA